MDESKSETTNPIRFGIIGCTNIAAKLARAISLAPNATLYAVVSRSVDKPHRFATAVGPAIKKIYGSYFQLLEDPCVDAVYLPLPNSLNLQWAVAAERRKKHLLVEKPAALDAAELDRILEECRSNGVQFMDGAMWLHHLRTLTRMDLISDSTLFGQVNYIDSKEETKIRAPEKRVDKDKDKQREGKFKAFTGFGRTLDGDVVLVQNNLVAMESEEQVSGSYIKKTSC